MSNKEKIQSTLKSADTEEWIDVVFTRPIGYFWAMLFKRLNVHPNVVTVISMILGAASALFFYHKADTVKGVIYNIIGVVLLMHANFYDSADGQLARMTGKKTRLGRILDGAAGDVWFLCIYLALAFRIYDQTIPFSNSIHWGVWGFVLFAFAGICCHSRQSGLADYYRQIHLFFLKGKDGSELDNYMQQKAIYKQTKWKHSVIWKAFLFSYVRYTKAQEKQTPQFQRLVHKLQRKYRGNLPQKFRDEFRKRSLPLMKWTNILTFNVRAIVLYISCLIDMPYIYALFEIFVMSAIYFYMRNTHEKMCIQLMKDVKAGTY